MDLRDKLKFWLLLSSYVEMIVRGTSPLSLPDAIADSLAYLKAFGGTEQRNLPDGYIERQFIYMMDGSYLLTDIVPTYDGRYELDMQTTNIANSPVTYLGCVQSTGTSQGLRFAHITNGAVRVAGFGSNVDSAGGTIAANTRYKFVWNNNVATVTTGETTVLSNTFSDNQTVGFPLAINAYNIAGTIYGNLEGIYLYGFKAWNNQGQLIADYVPAIQKGTVPVVGFYDTVSKTFKTATAGTFAAGGEAVPTPDTPMDIVSNNGVLKARHQSGLPLGYTLLEYIQSSGTQYIDTGYVPNANTKIRIHGIQGETDCALFGVSLIFYCFSNNPTALHYNIAGSSNTLGVNIQGLDATIVMSATDGLVINGTQLATITPGSSTANYSMALFGRIDNTSGNIAKLGSHRIYSCELWDNGVLVRNFVPAKRNSGNAIGMYDTVTGTFFTNQGTGTFTAGNAVSDPVEIYTDGTVETINVHGKNLFDSATKIDGTILDDIGNESENVLGSVSDYIKVKPNTTYTLSFIRTLAGIYTRICTYSADKTFVALKVKDIYTDAGYKTYTFTTDSNAEYIRFCFKSDTTNIQLELGSTATEYQPYFDGGTATAEMLLKVGNYQDEQEILSGAVTRNVGVKVLDGTENWQASGPGYFLANVFSGLSSIAGSLCTHFTVSNTNSHPADMNIDFGGVQPNNLFVRYDAMTTVSNFTQYLATQYNAGTPVIIVYPLASDVEEYVTEQPMQVTEGDNFVEITQASMSNLELEAKYKKGA